MVDKQAVNSISVDVELEGKPFAFVLLSADGVVNRLGPTSNDLSGFETTGSTLCKGSSEEGLFRKLMQVIPDSIFQYCGKKYEVPNVKGKICELTIAFGHDSDRSGLQFVFGTESGGVPREVSNILERALEVTDRWYRDQLEAASAES